MISSASNISRKYLLLLCLTLSGSSEITESHFNTRRHLNAIGITLKTPQVELGDSPAQIFLETVLAGEATLESNQKRVDAKDNQLSTRRKGRLTQEAPLGYLNQRLLEGPRRTIVVHDPERAPIIAECFRIFANSNRSKVDIHKWAVEQRLNKSEEQETRISPFLQ